MPHLKIDCVLPLRRQPKLRSAVVAGLSLASALVATSSAAWALDGGGLSAQVIWRSKAAGETAEIGAYDATTRRLFVTGQRGVSVIDSASGQAIALIQAAADMQSTSVTCSRGVAAVAWAAHDRRRSGRIVVYDAKTLIEIASLQAGHNPDMLVFASDGRRLACANEGEPTDDYSCDPPGSITLADLPEQSEDWSAAVVRRIGFEEFNGRRDELRRAGVRLFGPSHVHEDRQATVAEDLEPEYVATSADGKRAWVTLQENNAVAELDLDAGRVVAIHPLGLKPFFRADAESRRPRSRGRIQTVGLDASDRDGRLHPRELPVYGIYQPDAIAVIQEEGEVYLLTANEGDARKYVGLVETCRVDELQVRQVAVDPRLEEWVSAKSHPEMSRLVVATTAGDADDDGDIDELCTFGGRSFSVWRATAAAGLEQEFDSGSEFERQIEAAIEEDRRPDERSVDARSPVSGPEPEGIVVGTVDGRRLAFVTLERAGGVMIYDVVDPTHPKFCLYLPPQCEDGVCDAAPESAVLINAEDGPAGGTLLAVCNEVSGTVTTYELSLTDSGEGALARQRVRAR